MTELDIETLQQQIDDLNKELADLEYLVSQLVNELQRTNPDFQPY